MKNIFSLALLILTCVASDSYAAIEEAEEVEAATAEVTIQSADTVFETKLSDIQKLIDQKKYIDAVHTSIRHFNLDDSACKAFEVRPISAQDSEGNTYLTHTPYTQIVTLDPTALAFKSARFLVSFLAHETVHCHQHQRLFMQAVQTDARLEPFKKAGLLELKLMSDLDELANVASKEGPLKQQALKEFNAKLEKAGATMSVEEFVKLAAIAVSDMRNFEQKLGTLVEMQSILASFEVAGLLSPTQTKLPEFQFHLHALEKATQSFIHERKLLGASDELYCKLSNSVPFSLTIQVERTCMEAMAFLNSFSTEMASK